MGKRLIDVALDGVVTNALYEEAEDALHVETVQDVEPILDHNKRLMTMNDGYSPSRDLRRVASIPNVIWERLMREGIADDPKALKRWLNDPDNRYFRTAPGRV